jgi:hypothetical protein
MSEPTQPTDVFDILRAQTCELADVRFTCDAYRVWFRASLDKLNGQNVEIERQRRQIAALIDENRRLRGHTQSEAA